MYVLQKLGLGSGGVTAEKNVNIVSELLLLLFTLQLRAAYKLAKYALFDVVSADQRGSERLDEQVVYVLRSRKARRPV